MPLGQVPQGHAIHEQSVGLSSQMGAVKAPNYINVPDKGRGA